MTEEKVYYVTAESLKALQEELEHLKNKKIPDISTIIDAARQQGDLSENAEYHQAREDMSWAQGRLRELEYILERVQIITTTSNGNGSGVITIGNTVKIKVGDKEKEYTIVGPQEANPLKGLISNESPIGEALIGHKKGEKIEITTPAGKQIYEILAIK